MLFLLHSYLKRRHLNDDKAIDISHTDSFFFFFISVEYCTRWNWTRWLVSFSIYPSFILVPFTWKHEPCTIKISWDYFFGMSRCHLGIDYNLSDLLNCSMSILKISYTYMWIRFLWIRLSLMSPIRSLFHSPSYTGIWFFFS